MSITPIFLTLLALTTRTMAFHCFNCSPAMTFRGDDTTQYQMSKGSPKALDSVTACFWLSVPTDYLRGHYPTPVSYASDSSTNGNEFMLMLMPRLVVFFKDRRFKTGLHLGDGNLHHVCVTWESSTGNLVIYNDGEFVKWMRNVQQGEPIAAGGTWVIGQDQDRVGGGFHTRDTFKGTLTAVNIWSRVLCHYEVKRLAEECGTLVQGDYKAYSDFKENVAFEKKHENLACCPSV